MGPSELNPCAPVLQNLTEDLNQKSQTLGPETSKVVQTYLKTYKHAACPQNASLTRSSTLAHQCIHSNPGNPGACSERVSDFVEQYHSVVGKGKSKDKSS